LLKELAKYKRELSPKKIGIIVLVMNTI